MSNIKAYHESVTDELDAIKNRIRNLVTHWATDGEWKEAALRAVLRRHLPSSVFVGRGFVMGRDDSSTQIDLLVLQPEKPTLFRDGDLAIVTPDAPAAIAEVKTSLDGPAAWKEAAIKLAAHGRRCLEIGKQVPWLGLFSYGGELKNATHVLNALCEARRETGIAINCVTCGYDLFVRYWPKGQYEPGDNPVIDRDRLYWRAYDLTHLSPSYFISNLVDAICDVDKQATDYAWFALQGGKGPHKIAEQRAED
jgi:hypothetical protein